MSDTVQLANHKSAFTTGPDGNTMAFEADVPQEVSSEFAHSLLSIKDAGYYVPGDNDPVHPVDPSVNEAERRGRTRQSPFPAPPSAEEEQKAIDEFEANLAMARSGLEIPPKYGRGSSAAAWYDYAHALGHEPPDDLGRDGVIDYLEARHVPTEQPGETATIGGAPADEEDEAPSPAAVQTEVDPEPVHAEVDPDVVSGDGG